MPTYGGSAPYSRTINFDTLMSTSLAYSQQGFINQIKLSSPVFDWFQKSGAWVRVTPGSFYEIRVRYGFGDVYIVSGFDKVPMNRQETITAASFEFKQFAAPIIVSHEEKRKNANRLLDFAAEQIQAAKDGINKFFPAAFFQGSLYQGGSDIRQPARNSVGTEFVLPLPHLVEYTGTNGTPSIASVGGIPTDSIFRGDYWWRNQSRQSAATTYSGLEDELMQLWIDCSRTILGPPDVIVCDPTTWKLLNFILQRRREVGATPDSSRFGFQDISYLGNIPILWDFHVPNVAANSRAGSLDTTAPNGGTLYMLNSKSFRMAVDSETDMVAWAPADMGIQPMDQLAYVNMLHWLGCSTINNRAANGVLGNIARSLTVS